MRKDRLSDIAAPVLIKQEKPGLHLGREGYRFGLARVQVQEKGFGEQAPVSAPSLKQEDPVHYGVAAFVKGG
jgi:hypothetical protein